MHRHIHTQAQAHTHTHTHTQARIPGAIAASLTDLNDLALALCAGAERRRETTHLGLAFAKATAAYSQKSISGLTLLDGDIALPVAVGIEGALGEISLESLLPASLQASSSNLVWIATRLVPLGQTEALRMIANLQPLVQATAHKAAHAGIEDVGSGTLLADLASIEHEQLTSRICIT